MNKPQNKSNEEALKVARSTQKPNQTKQQTKLIAQGIQKGIEQYKKQHKAKLREQDKLKKKNAKASNTPMETEIIIKQPVTAWVLLGVSWVGFTAYILAKSLFL